MSGELMLRATEGFLFRYKKKEGLINSPLKMKLKLEDGYNQTNSFQYIDTFTVDLPLTSATTDNVSPG